MNVVDEICPIYKVARIESSPAIFKSAIMRTVHHAVTYRIGEWSEAPEKAARAGYHLLAFSEFRYAKAFSESLIYPSVVLRSTATGIVKPLPPAGIMQATLAVMGMPPGIYTDTSWPTGTIMVMRLRPDLVVYAQPMHLAQI